ncbi:MAG: type IV secretory system conjugative DNA transfer family protein [Bacteroidia bacterium]
MHIATTQEGDERSLTTLWKWARLTGDDWQNLLAEIRDSDVPVNGEIIRNLGNEILKLTEAGDETFGNILSTVLQSTDFLKSPALQKAMQSGFDPYKLAKGNTALYIIIPADKLKSHFKWLRLMVTVCLRAVIRRPQKRVAFLLDEFAALGYLPEIETALSTYAGYQVTICPILQSLIQLKDLYGDNWETFTANCTIRQFFSVNDNFTAEYVSTAIGKTSNPTSDGMNARHLVTPDELRRYSGKNIFAFFESSPPTYFNKYPYYIWEKLKGRADANPYI